MLHASIGKSRRVFDSQDAVTIASDWVMEEAALLEDVATIAFSVDLEGGLESIGGQTYLRFAINVDTGFAGVIWFTTLGSGRRDEISRHVWVSENPEPPDFDPLVISDLHVPVYLAPRSTLPIPQAKQALDDFCRMGTGDRPECIRWAEGNANGLLIGAPWPEATEGGLF